MIREWLLKKTLRIITKHEILDTISEERQKGFKAEAKDILAGELWKWIIEDMYLKTEREMFNHSRTNEGWWFAKGMLYALDLLQDKVQEFAIKKLPLSDSKDKKLMKKLV